MASGTVAAEDPMEARIARLESDIGHLRSDVTEVKVRQVITKIDGLGDSVASIRTWTLTVLATFAALVFGTMARGFGWI
jgi:hypothetical protein